MRVPKYEKLVRNLYGKKYVVYIKTLQQALIHKLKLKTIDRVVKYN